MILKQFKWEKHKFKQKENDCDRTYTQDIYISIDMKTDQVWKSTMKYVNLEEMKTFVSTNGEDHVWSKLANQIWMVYN